MTLIENKKKNNDYSLSVKQELDFRRQYWQLYCFDFKELIFFIFPYLEDKILQLRKQSLPLNYWLTQDWSVYFKFIYNLGRISLLTNYNLLTENHNMSNYYHNVCNHINGFYL